MNFGDRNTIDINACTGGRVLALINDFNEAINACG